MVTVVAAPFVQRHQEEVGPLQPFEHLQPVGSVRERLAQGAAQGLDHGGSKQELSNVLRLTGENFVGQIVEDVAGATLESLDRSGLVLAEGMCRQLQADD